jgi:hypothetical protein
MRKDLRYLNKKKFSGRRVSRDLGEHLKSYIHIVACAPDLRRGFFHGLTEYLRHSTTIEVLLLLILIKEPYPSLKPSLPYWEVVICLVAAIARKFIQSRHADRYLLPKRSPIPASAN